MLDHVMWKFQDVALAQQEYRMLQDDIAAAKKKAEKDLKSDPIKDLASVALKIAFPIAAFTGITDYGLDMLSRDDPTMPVIDKNKYTMGYGASVDAAKNLQLALAELYEGPEKNPLKL